MVVGFVSIGVESGDFYRGQVLVGIEAVVKGINHVYQVWRRSEWCTSNGCMYVLQGSEVERRSV